MANRYAPPQTQTLDSSTVPRVPRRPSSINWAVAALWIAYVLSLIHAIIVIGSRWLLWPPEPVVLTQVASELFYAVLIFGISKGKNWARLFYPFLLGIRTVNVIEYFSVDWENSRRLVLVTLVSFACQYAAIYLLYTGAGRRWFTRSLTEPQITTK